MNQQHIRKLIYLQKTIPNTRISTFWAPISSAYLQSPSEKRGCVLCARHVSCVIEKVVNRTDMVSALLCSPCRRENRYLIFKFIDEIFSTKKYKAQLFEPSARFSSPLPRGGSVVTGRAWVLNQVYS